MARVDVIVPVFNTKLSYVVAAVDSLRAQTLSDWIAWVADDGSDGAYAADLRKMLDALGDARFLYHRIDHKGIGAARNSVISKGRAPYLAFVDSDDVLLPNHLEQQVAALEADPGVAVVHSNCITIDADGNTLYRSTKAGLNEMDARQSFVQMLMGNYVGLSTVVMRRTDLEKIGGFDETIQALADKELWMRLLGNGAKFHHIPQLSVQYRIHAGNNSKKTEVLLGVRTRLIEQAESLLEGNGRFAGVDWPALRRKMERHMYLEAAEAHYAARRYSQALAFASPARVGVSARSIRVLLPALVRSVVSPGGGASSKPSTS